MKEQLSQLSSLDIGIFNVKNLRVLENGPYGFDLTPGETIGVTGQSGVGKSQLLRALVDITPWQGTIKYNGSNCHDVPAVQWRKTIGLVPAEPVWWHKTVREHFPSVPHNQFDTDGHLKRLGFVPEVMDWQVSRLSSGEKQRLAILRALVNWPKVLLLDEPTANLDNHFTAIVEEILMQYQTDQGAAFVLVSHDLEQLCRFSTKQYTMLKDALVEVDANTLLESES